MSSEKIGQAAGAIWTKLHDKGTTGLGLTDLKKVAGFTQDELLAGIGWLAREGKLSFREGSQRKLIVTLVEEEIFT